MFDLDRTLTRRPTYTRFLLALAREVAPSRLALLPALPIGMARYMAGGWSRDQLKRWMHWTLAGPAMPRKTALAVARRFAEHEVADGLFADALSRLEGERAAGRRVLIATAANSVYAEPIAGLLGVEWVASRSRWSGDSLLAGQEGGNCHGAAKAAAVAAWLAVEELTDAHLRVFSDHISDAPLYERADEAVVVNPSRALARRAHRRGWRVERWR